jgi:GNAT superfamily N-acetyltransferase
VRWVKNGVRTIGAECLTCDHRNHRFIASRWSMFYILARQVRHFSSHSQLQSMMPPSIRQTTIADAPVITRFNALLAIETEQITLDQDRLRKGVESLLRDPTKGFYIVAEHDNVVVGQLMITFEWSDWRNGVFWWIQSVYVEKEARGTGVFQALFDHIHTLAKKTPDVCGLRLYVEKKNTRAKQTYERLAMHSSHYEMYEMDFVLQDSF